MFSYDANYPLQEPDAREALVCARLNLRGAKRLLQKGSFQRGISALYDSLLFGMHYYVARHKSCADVDLTDAVELFHTLSRAGVFEDQLAFNRLSLTIERFLWQGPDSFDANPILIEVEEMLRKLGVISLQKSTLRKKSKIPR